ncbi:Fe-S cluster assembly protein SufD [Synechococcus sp. PCC 6312]|uniref:Fe-S cluster assembly protein SufD n=1 Tax=Synechococcus sp. (strain ATCC 27167 / PCC 6312) TaxID=195253 RepID=UPI00029F4933|nr:Fe-S cluster assembly protein SufD [Synechococcus sp. PCC 6312]AFY60149.1 Iron-regulated ABC transporter permease protein SufD [Synechococcus sp. PCC 6312]
MLHVIANSDSPVTTAHKTVTQLGDLLKLRQELDEVVLGQAGLATLGQLRQTAADALHEQFIPTTRQEEWRFTDLSLITQAPFSPPAHPPDLATLPTQRIAEKHLRMVLVNGVYAPDLSDVGNSHAGVMVGNLAQARPETLALLGQLPGREEVFTALNTASCRDVLTIEVGAKVCPGFVIHLVFLTTAPQATLISPRVLVVLQPGSSLTLVEDYISGEMDTALTNAVTEIYLGNQAELDHTRIQRQAPTALHIGKTVISQAQHSQYSGHAITWGGQLSRHNWDVNSNGPETTTILEGLTVATANQLADTHSSLIFSAPHCSSQQVNKYIVGGRARAVFNGKIVVPQAAQMTDASQLSRNLLLSPKARIDTKPQLEIVADNVKCSHGATVSQLAEDDVFYLQSRGLDLQQARDLLIRAFAVELLDGFQIPSLAKELAQNILSHIHQANGD